MRILITTSLPNSQLFGSVIRAGKAYWVKASAPGKIVLQSSGPGPAFGSRLSGQGSVLDGLTSITLTDAQGSEQTLYIAGGGKVPEKVLEDFVERAGGERAHIAVVTSASETADNIDVESRLLFWRDHRLAALSVTLLGAFLVWRGVIPLLSLQGNASHCPE